MSNYKPTDNDEPKIGTKGNRCDLCGFAWIAEEFSKDGGDSDSAQVFVECPKCKIGHWMHFEPHWRGLDE